MVKMLTMRLQRSERVSDGVRTLLLASLAYIGGHVIEHVLSK